MAIRSKTDKDFWVLKYVESHKIIGVFVFYVIVSIILKTLLSIDILLPCLWKIIFDFDCPGCGLTLSFIHFLTLDFSNAYQANPMIFLLLPLSLIYLYFDVQKYKMRKG